METVKPQNPKSGLMTRVISALVMIPPVIAAIYYGSPYFDVLIYLGLLLLAWEWTQLCGKDPKWMVFGAFYIAIPCWALLHIRDGGDYGLQTVLWLFGVVWAMDIGAYAFGKTIGGPKLIPSVSPNKTWAGLIGGSLSAGGIGILTASMIDHNSMILLFFISVVIGIISQIGDLIESALKRHFDVKDSGSIIPGHGGIFDRVDGLLTAATTVMLVEYLIEGELLLW